MTAQTQDQNKKEIIKWIATFLVPFLLWIFIPVTEVFTIQMKGYVVITFLAIMMLIFETVSTALIGIMLPVLYIIFGVVKPGVAFASWGSHIVWLVLGSLMFADVLIKCGLAKRMAYKCVVLVGGSYRGILIGVTLAAIVLNLFVPSKAHFVLAPFCYSLVLALGFKKSKEAAGIMIMAAAACSIAGMFLFTPNIVLMEEIGAEVTGPLALTWVDYIIKNIPTIFYLFFIVWVFSIIYKPKTKIESKEFFDAEFKKMGPLKKDEKKMIVACIVLLTTFLTTSIHGIALGWCFITVAVFLYAPVIGVANQEDLKRVNYGFVIFLAACYTIGNVAGALGMGELFANVLLPYLEGRGITFVLVMVWLVCVILNVLMTPQALVAALTLPLAQISMELGINPHATYFVMLQGFDQLFFPYESGVYLIFFSFGLFSLREFIKGMYLKMLLSVTFIIFALIPYWKMIGFLYSS